MNKLNVLARALYSSTETRQPPSGCRCLEVPGGKSPRHITYTYKAGPGILYVPVLEAS